MGLTYWLFILFISPFPHVPMSPMIRTLHLCWGHWRMCFENAPDRLKRRVWTRCPRLSRSTRYTQLPPSLLLKHTLARSQFALASSSSLRSSAQEAEISSSGIFFSLLEAKMAACAASTQVAAGVPSLCVSRKAVKASGAAQASFAGLRAGNKVDCLSISRSSFGSQTAIAKSAARTTCAVDTALTITLSTGALLFLGRFVFLPFQRDNVSKQGLPVQNGVTHFEAGDSRAQEVVGVLKTNDPAGFTLVDVLAWGALGHAIGFFILATANNGYTPTF